MNDAERIEISDIVEVLKGLDNKDLTLLMTGAEVLKARRELDRQEKTPA